MCPAMEKHQCSTMFSFVVFWSMPHIWCCLTSCGKSVFSNLCYYSRVFQEFLEKEEKMALQVLRYAYVVNLFIHLWKMGEPGREFVRCTCSVNDTARRCVSVNKDCVDEWNQWHILTNLQNVSFLIHLISIIFLFTVLLHLSSSGILDISDRFIFLSDRGRWENQDLQDFLDHQETGSVQRPAVVTLNIESVQYKYCWIL